MTTPTPKTGRCQRCSQPRPLFTYTYLAADSECRASADLCVRCYSHSKIENDPRRLEEDLFYAIGNAS